MGKTDMKLGHSVNFFQKQSKGERDGGLAVGNKKVRKGTAAEWEVRRKGDMLACQQNRILAPKAETRRIQKLQVPRSTRKIWSPRIKRYLGKQRLPQIPGTPYFLP